ncbi:c-type cytochrome [filamentous cyanobacterium LEGE 11480]|uniref:C-type cytochrome n=2 Tax=Romeriopsis TaxID=2992131 RepID=A0A928Z4M9_9CYAN|nr:c-type cytochrome [Romeriopsis navalis LEGE 11480]
MPGAMAPAVAATGLELGATVFEAQCAACHVGGGNIIRRGKNLKSKALERNHVDTLELVKQLVIEGKGNMSAYGDRLTEAEIDAVSAYVLAQAAAGWPGN